MFKAGDKIAPTVKSYPRHWELMEVVSYNKRTKEATVKDLDGDIITDFNLNPHVGVPFKVVG